MTTARIVKRIGIWTGIGLVTTVVIVVAALYIFSGSIVGPALAPLQLSPLSPATQNARTASPDGTWRAGDGSIAGFRVQEAFLVQSGTIVGRTSAMTGSLVISHHEIISGSFPVDLSKLTIGGKPNASFFQLMETRKYPDATLTLTKTIVFASIPTNGQTISSKATASLAMHGITHTVTFTIMARSNGTVLEATGTVPFLASDWSITSPFGIQNHDVIEFLVVLRRG
ncbi:MAG: YceI family protein [Ktedonobacteraceae bacterium]|nr:YceI family protein [Chloroflexota bacterium]